jgi:hypothetical protein
MARSKLWQVLLATLLIGAAAPPPLSVYVGHYPFDRVRGTTFLAHPRVRATVAAAVPDRRIRGWIFERAGPHTPITRLRDGRLASFGCEAHNCGSHNWAILIDPAGREAEVCYHDDAAIGRRSRWYARGRAPVLRAAGCQPE